jgi:hypothetical protein
VLVQGRAVLVQGRALLVQGRCETLLEPCPFE